MNKILDGKKTSQRIKEEIKINDIYGPDAGGIAKFTSLLTQYGTGFAVAQKVAKKLLIFLLLL